MHIFKIIKVEFFFTTKFFNFDGPSLGSCELLSTIGSAFSTFIGYKRTEKQSKYIEKDYFYKEDLPVEKNFNPLKT